METVAVKKQEDFRIQDVFWKLEDMKTKHAFLTKAIVDQMNEAEIADEIVSGFQLLMFSLEDEFKEVDTMLDALLDVQRRFESAKVTDVLKRASRKE